MHYCVPNMPSAVARTATLALTQATLPYALKLANADSPRPARKIPDSLHGLQVHRRQGDPRRTRRGHQTSLHAARRSARCKLNFIKVIRL